MSDRPLAQIISDLDTDPQEWWPCSRSEARLLVAEVARLRALLAEGIDLTKDMNWSDAGDDWWGRAYDAVKP